MGQKVTKCCKCSNGKHLKGASCNDSSSDGSKDGAPITPEPRRRLKVTGNVIQLALDNVQKNDAGMYTVMAKSPSGVASRDLELRVNAGAKASGDSDEPPAFLRRLNDLSVKVGTRTRFLVEIRSCSQLSIEWLHNEEPAEEGERLNFVNEGGFHCIDVAPVTAYDAGRWTCVARNEFGQASSCCHLNVLVPKTYKPPEFLEELCALLTEQGTVSLECKVVGVPTPLLRWFKDGKEIKAGDVFALTANPEDPTSLGTYVCEAVNCMGTAYSSSKVHVVGKGSREGSLKPADSPIPSGPPPIFTRDLQNEAIKIGDPLMLSCQVSVPPWPKSVAWYNSEGRIEDESPGSRYRQLADGIGGYMLEVKQTEAGDQGEWKCVATSQDGTVSISTCDVKMTIPKHFRKPRFMDSLKAVLTEEGLVSFECKVVGSPTPLLRWFKDGQELKPGDVYQLTGTNSLGSYCCIAKNCMGEARSSAELTVEDIQSQLNDEERAQLILRSQAPKFLHGLKSSEAKINETFRFTIQVSVATPLPSLAWYRDDQPIEIEPDRYLAIKENLGVSHLDIVRVEFMDQAEWKCVATNEFGHSVTSCFLKLIIPKHFKKPKFLECLRAVLSEEGAVNLECKVIGVPPPVLKWYKDGVELKPGDIHRITSGEDGTCCLGTYTCEARNCMGTIASSASLLGFEDQKTRAQQQRMELARQPSLSTINEERTSQMYDTATDQSLTIDDRGEVSFSFDGKEVSVSLYETPDLTEEEAIQIVEMYADQLSEHVSAHNVVELPPLRFVKESSTSGNLLMEAVVVDVSEDYFTPEDQDLRTEADIEEIFSITDETGQPLSSVTSEKIKIDVNSSGEAPKRPPRKTDSQKSNSYYSLSKNASLQSDPAEESLAVVADLDSESYGEYESAMSSEKEKKQEQDRAFQVAAITETTSLPGDDDRRPLTPRTSHEIGSDLRVNRSESQELQSRRRSSQSSDEISKDGLIRKPISLASKTKSLDIPDDIFQRDIQGEEGDGLVIDPEVSAAKQKELKLEEMKIIDELKLNISEIQQGLLNVEEKLFVQTTLKSTSATAKQSLEALTSILQPFRDIQTVLQTIEQEERPSEVSAVELIAPPIFELQKSLAVVEKCIEMQGKDHTLIQKTCANILDTTGLQLQRGLKLVESITLLEKELDSTKVSGRMTPSKIIQEVCITLKEMQNGLQNADTMLQTKYDKSLEEASSSFRTESKSETIIDLGLVSKIAEAVQELRWGLDSLEKTIAYEETEEMYSNLREVILVKLANPVEILMKEIAGIRKETIRFRGEKSLDQEVRVALIDKLSPPIEELAKGLEIVKKQKPNDLHSGPVNVKILESFVAPVDEIFSSVEKIKKNIQASGMGLQSRERTSSVDVVQDVFDQVSQIVYNNISRSIDEFLLNIETAQKVISDTVILEALRQLSTLQKDLASTVLKVSKIKIEAAMNATENLAEPIEVLNNQIVQIIPTTSRDILDDIIASLNILEENIIVDEETLETMDLCIPFSILRGRTSEVRENICGLTEHGTVVEPLKEDSVNEGSVVVILEDSSDTVVPIALLDDTKQAVVTLQNNVSNQITISLENVLQDLEEIINDEMLGKKKEDLTEDEKLYLQNYVAPLEQVEDALIEAQDRLMEEQTVLENDNTRLILEHLQYNVAVMHQQILDEVMFMETEEPQKCTIDDLKKCIANIQNLPVMSEATEAEYVVSSATGKEIIKNVFNLERCLAILYEETVVEGAQGIEPEVFQKASEVIERVENLTARSLFAESGEPVVTVQDIAEIKKLSEPLRELDETITNIQKVEEDRKKAFSMLRQPLLNISDVIMQTNNDEIKTSLVPVEEALGDALEVLSIEQDVPGAIPGEPVVVDSGRNWISLSWGKPDHRGAAPVIAYRVDAWLRGGEGARWTTLGVSPINSYDAFNLKPEGEYQFRITPRNRYGWGESVQSSTITIGSPTEYPEFTKILPGQLKVLLGSNLVLECEVRKDSSTTIRWFQDSNEIIPTNDDRCQISYKHGICSLRIAEVCENDSGRFMCEATNKSGRVSSFARVFIVHDPKILTADKNLKIGIRDFDKVTELLPQFTMRLRDRRVQVSYPVRLTCQVAGCPEPAVKWTKDGQEIKEDARHTLWSEENFQTLEINKTTLDDSGNYSIIAYNVHGSVSCTCNLVVDKGIRAYISPEFRNGLEPVILDVKEGGELRLSAIVEAYPIVGVMWYRNGVRLRPSRKSIMTLSYDGRVELAVASVTRRDAGVYTCVATNEVGRAETSATVNVLSKEVGNSVPDISCLDRDIPYSREPKFLKKPRSTDAFEGDNIVILCEVIGDPKPDVVWLRDFLKPDYYRDASHFHRIGDGPEYRLEIPNAKLDFTGTYTVYAKNSHGDAKAIISLQIKVRDVSNKLSAMDKGKVIGNVQTIPCVIQELKDLRCCDGDAVVLECKFEGAPSFETRWEKDGKLIRLGDDFNAEFDGVTAKLSINQVYPEDEGEYTCVAYNDLGKTFTSACLVVDLPEEKENLLKQQLIRPANLSSGSTPISTPRATPSRGLSPRPKQRDTRSPGQRSLRIRALPPKFYAVPHNRVVEEGDTVKFQAAVAGHPDPWVTWQKDGVVMTSSSRITVSETDDLRVIEIRQVTPKDSGIYKITLENDVGRIEASARLEVISHRPASSKALRARSLSPKAADSYNKSLMTSSARYGSSARLFYDIRSVPTPYLKWYKNDVPDEESNKQTIPCIGEDRTQSEDIWNQSTPKTLEHLPKILNALEGTPIELRMKVSGQQPFDIVWMKDGCVLPDCHDYQQITHEDGRIVLMLPDAYPQDSGDYRCEIYNVFGETSSKCQLIVNEKSSEGSVLEFVKLPSPSIAFEGKNVSFGAKLRNVDENIEILWEVGGVPVYNSGRFQIEEDCDVSILHIVGVTHLDAGEVKCTATKQSHSTSGEETISYTTVLQVVPNLDDISDSVASMEAVDEVIASGELPKIEEPAVLLRKPQDTTALVADRVLLKATYMGHPEPVVRWTRAGKELRNDERTSITSGDGVSCLLLQNITADDSGKYDICVENCLGTDSSYASVSVEGPPDPPSGKPCVSADMDSVTVAWSSSPYDGGKIVTGFAVEYSLAGSEVWTTAIENCYSLSFTVKGLQLGGRYIFRVRALNVHGYSKPSLETDVLQLEEKNESSSFEPRIVIIEPGPEFKERFEVLEELGKGRFGIVHKVIDKIDNQKLAAKFIRCRTSKDRDKVQDEIDIMNLLRHQKLLQLAAAFEHPKEMVMVTEYISGGELFERVVADDFTLTEKDCILFMRQICEGVAYMHTQNIVHLDLKPENIMCHTRTSHEIKIIDFGLAQKLNPNTPVRVLFGTPEFIPPEIINYEPIGTESDMWSLGVICYVLLSGLSPFMGDNDAETFANITRADYDFDDEAFDAVSQNARNFIGALLVKRKEDRMPAQDCLKHTWLDPENHKKTVILSTDKLKKFIIRRKWQVYHRAPQAA